MKIYFASRLNLYLIEIKKLIKLSSIMDSKLIGSKQGKVVMTTDTVDQTQDSLEAKVYQARRDSDSFFTNPKNKHMIRYILSYLSPEEKIIVKKCSRVILFAIILEVQQFNVKEIKDIKLKWYQIMSRKANYETFLRGILGNEDDKDQMFYNHKILFKHWDLFMNEYFPRWIYNFFFKRDKFPALDLIHQNQPRSEVGIDLFLKFLPYIRNLSSLKVKNVYQDVNNDLFPRAIKKIYFKALRSLELEKIILADDIKKFIVETILHETVNLVYLTLNELALDNSHIAQMVNAFYKMKNLEFLSLVNNNMTDSKRILLYLASNPNLQTLILDNFPLGKDGMTLLASVLESNKNLCTLSIRNMKIITSTSKAFWESLKGNSTLETIIFDDNPFAINGIESLVKVVPTTNLKSISIKNCILSKDLVAKKVKSLTIIKIEI